MTKKTIISLVLASLLSCNQTPKGPIAEVTTDSVNPQTTNIVNEGNNQAIVNLKKLNFNKIIFGDTQKDWNKYAADQAITNPNIELVEQFGDYYMKVSRENNQNLYSFEERPVFKNMTEGVSAAPVKIDGNTSEQFLQMVVRDYGEIYDPSIINAKVADLINQYNLTYKYGISDMHATAPNLDPNDAFFKLYQNYKDEVDQSVTNATSSGSTKNTGSYVGKKQTTHSSQLGLFESGDMYVSLNVFTNSSYTVDKIGDNYSIKDANTLYALEVELFPKTYAPANLFDKYGSTGQKEAKSKQDKNQKLIQKANN